jgi:uncharacterized protein
VLDALAGLPLLDHHCHSLVETWTDTTRDAAAAPAWRGCFTESADPVTLARDVPELLAYRHFLAALAGRLDLEPSAERLPELEARVAARRDELALADPGGYLAGLLDHAGVAGLLVDTGFGQAVLPPAELERVARRPVREVARLEQVAEQVLRGGAASLGAFADAVEARLRGALSGGAVALKSIAAYRTGLALPPAGATEQRRAFAALDQEAQARRFDDPVLLGVLVRMALRLGAELAVPLQFHTGFGDADLRLPAADPSLLAPLLREPDVAGCPVVLLHCWPFVGQAAWLAGIAPQVHIDLSLAVPLAEPLAARLVAEALALCPAGKLLAASDGHSYPEMHWWGAIVWRRALAEVLGAEVERGRLGEHDAVELGGRILGGNAAALYRLEP